MSVPTIKQLAARIRPYVHFYGNGVVRIDVRAWLRDSRPRRKSKAEG